MTAVPPVTPKAEKGLTLLQKVIRNGAMCIMAERTPLFYRRMFIEKGSLLIGMAVKTELINGNVRQLVCFCAMGAVAFTAFHFTFPDRMVGRKLNPGFHLLVTIIAQIRFTLVEHLLFGDFVGFMAVITSHVT
jgi:hypothetical protein